MREEAPQVIPGLILAVGHLSFSRPLAMKIRLSIALLFCANLAAAAAQQNPVASRVQVILTSDFNTWVSISNTRVPEKLREARLALPPGDYEVLGRRKGYRDVVHILRLRAGMAPVRANIVCIEKASD